MELPISASFSLMSVVRLMALSESMITNVGLCFTSSRSSAASCVIENAAITFSGSVPSNPRRISFDFAEREPESGVTSNTPPCVTSSSRNSSPRVTA